MKSLLEIAPQHLKTQADVNRANQNISNNVDVVPQNILMSWTTNLTMGLAMERYLAVCRFHQINEEKMMRIELSTLICVL